MKVFGALVLLVHCCDFDTVAYAFLNGSVTGPSTCYLASWNGMFFWYFTLIISFSIFHLGQLLTYAGWSPLQLAHFASFSHSWSSCPACPYFAHFGSFLKYLLLWPYLWQSNVVDLECKLLCHESGNQLWSEGVCLDYLWSICRNLKEPTAHLFASSCVQLWSHLVIAVHF